MALRNARRLRRLAGLGPAFWFASAWLLLITFGAALADVLPIRRTDDPDFLLGALIGDGRWRATFSRVHPLGVDESGNDLLSYAVHGARTSLVVGAITVAFALVVGGTLGLVAGYARGRIDGWLTFLANAVLSIPPLLFLLLLVAVLSARTGSVSVIGFCLTLGSLSVPLLFRVVRAATMRQASLEYVMAARSLGARPGRVLARELLPNVIKPALSFALVMVGTVMVIEGSLSFLGAGLSASTISWGKMIQTAAGMSKLRSGPHATVVPAAFLFLTVLSLNLIGDTVRERLEVKQSGI